MRNCPCTPSQKEPRPPGSEPGPLGPLRYAQEESRREEIIFQEQEGIFEALAIDYELVSELM